MRKERGEKPIEINSRPVSQLQIESRLKSIDSYKNRAKKNS
jgi:hypothetical protein